MRLAWVELGSFVASSQAALKPIDLTSPPANLSAPILPSFVSFSIEFSSFPDFAGMWDFHGVMG
jgi:hypothetical protein